MLIPLPAPSARLDFSLHCPATGGCPWLHSGYPCLTQHLKEPRGESSLQNTPITSLEPTEPFICAPNPTFVLLYNAVSSIHPSLPYLPPPANSMVPALTVCWWQYSTVTSRSHHVLCPAPIPPSWGQGTLIGPRPLKPAELAICWAWLSSAQASTAYQGVLQLLASSIANSFAFLCWKCLAHCEHWQSQIISRLIRHPVAHIQHYSLKMRSWESLLAVDPWIVTLSLWWNLWESNQTSSPAEAVISLLWPKPHVSERAQGSLQHLGVEKCTQSLSVQELLKHSEMDYIFLPN